MKTSPAPKPTLAILGKRDLELGPFAIDEAPQEASPWANWRLRTDENGIAWLLFDKKEFQRQHLVGRRAHRTQRGAGKGRARPSARAGDPIGQALGLHRRRRHRPVPRCHRPCADRGGVDARPRGARPPRPAAAADRRRDPRLLPRRRARSGAGLRFPHRHRRRELRLSRSSARPASRPRRHGAADAADQPGAGHDHDAHRQDRARAPGSRAASGRCRDPGTPRARRGEVRGHRRDRSRPSRACSAG